MEMEPARCAAAYLSRVMQGPSMAMNEYIARVGLEEAADAVRRGFVPPKLRDRVPARRHMDMVKQDFETIESLDGRLVIPSDQEWPARLNLLTEPPLALWVRGGRQLASVEEKVLAVVGTRASSMYGETVGGDIAAALAGVGITIVSGGAFGIDGIAHRAALGIGGQTIAVMSCGLDKPHPFGHARLLERIAEDGLLVSEYPPGVVPAKHRFLERNRLVAGLSEGVVVIESGLRSGSRNTANQARAMGVPVMAVPGPVTSMNSAGCHEMIRLGEAVLVTTAAEVEERVWPYTPALI